MTIDRRKFLRRTTGTVVAAAGASVVTLQDASPAEEGACAAMLRFLVTKMALAPASLADELAPL